MRRGVAAEGESRDDGDAFLDELLRKEPCGGQRRFRGVPRPDDGDAGLRKKRPVPAAVEKERGLGVAVVVDRMPGAVRKVFVPVGDQEDALTLVLGELPAHRHETLEDGALVDRGLHRGERGGKFVVADGRSEALGDFEDGLGADAGEVEEGEDLVSGEHGEPLLGSFWCVVGTWSARYGRGRCVVVGRRGRQSRRLVDIFTILSRLIL